MNPGQVLATAAVVAAVAVLSPEGASAERGWATTYNDPGVFCPGEVFKAKALTAAHRTLPCGSLVKVTNTENGRSVVVRIIDRGPCNTPRCKRKHPEYAVRIIDLTKGAADAIGADGMTHVELEPVQGFEDRWKLVADAVPRTDWHAAAIEPKKTRRNPRKKAGWWHPRKTKDPSAVQLASFARRR